MMMLNLDSTIKYPSGFIVFYIEYFVIPNYLLLTTYIKSQNLI